ncbi:MAG TPA: glycoside hydrolase family 99-like domain-containing protein, partial [Rhodothermales bacterium]
PENDEWWGKGFTEWRFVTRATPQFHGHYQPHLPGELGFYDLRVPDVQERQIELAKLYGLHGFCYYHYWFHGKRLLRRPMDQLLSHPEWDFPFCLCWANENWTRRWDGRDEEWLIAQAHSPEDDLAFIRDIEPALRDPRYIRIGGRPLLLMYRPALLPDPQATAKRWRIYCEQVGIGDLFLMATHAFDSLNPRDLGFDAALEFVPNNTGIRETESPPTGINPQFRGRLYDYRELVEITAKRDAPAGYPLFRSVTPMWDNEARRPSNGSILINSSPQLYEQWLERTCQWTERHVGIDKPFVFVNAWNEWAEGAHLEPDQRHGYTYLQATANALARFPKAKRPPIVLVSHDAHLHGAQLIALSVVRALVERLHYDVEIILAGGGQLEPEFAALGRVHDFASPHLSSESKRRILQQLYDDGARIALCNTSVVGDTVELLKEVGFSTVSLVHELPGLIRERSLEGSAALIARHADRVVFPSEHVRDRFIEVTGPLDDRSVVQPQGLYAPNPFFDRREIAAEELRKQIGVQTQTPIILAVGFADRRKGVDLFVDVALRTVTGLPDAVFVWVGHHDADTFGQVRARIDAAGLSDRFRFPGAARNASLFFAGADAYLMTSREDPFPSVVLEALDAGLPVIAFDGAGGFLELVRKCGGVIVPFTDTAAMAAALTRLLTSDDRRVGDRARETLSRDFSPVNYARTLVELVGEKQPTISAIVPNYNYARYLE